MEKETGYGDYAYRAEPQVSKRSPDVALYAIERCEELMKELNDACEEIGKLTRELDEAKKYIDLLRESRNEIQESEIYR